jgi:hypothetical protein
VVRGASSSRPFAPVTSDSKEKNPTASQKSECWPCVLHGQKAGQQNKTRAAIRIEQEEQTLSEL